MAGARHDLQRWAGRIGVNRRHRFDGSDIVVLAVNQQERTLAEAARGVFGMEIEHGVDAGQPEQGDTTPSPASIALVPPCSAFSFA